MKTNKLILLVMLCFSAAIFAQDDDDMDDMAMENVSTDGIDAELVADAEDAIEAFKAADVTMEEQFNNAVGYVIFPNVGKGALVVGISAGNGIVYENGVIIGTADLKKLDVGLQAGGKAFSEAILFKTNEAFQRFKNEELEFAANASAVVLKSGKSAEAKYNDGLEVFILSKAGLMAEASVGGQKFDYNPIQN